MKENIIIVNKKAKFNYFLEDIYEAGIILKGTEVKSIRGKNIAIENSYAIFNKNEIYLIGLYISAYKNASMLNHNPLRQRKLLLKKKEVKKLQGKASLNGYSIIPKDIYFSQKNIVKISLAVAKGKKLHDKRQTIKEREWNRRKNKSNFI